VLSLGRKNETRIARVSSMHHVIMMVDPAREARAKLFNEG
jgi:hypothetical protein